MMLWDVTKIERFRFVEAVTQALISFVFAWALWHGASIELLISGERDARYLSGSALLYGCLFWLVYFSLAEESFGRLGRATFFGLRIVASALAIYICLAQIALFDYAEWVFRRPLQVDDPAYVALALWKIPFGKGAYVGFVLRVLPFLPVFAAIQASVLRLLYGKERQ